MIWIVLLGATLSTPISPCTTHYEATMQRYQTLCPDGTRATSTYSPTLRRWTTQIVPPGTLGRTQRLKPSR